MGRSLSPSSKAALDEHGDKLASLQDRILSWLQARPGIHTRAEIADRMGVATATMSGRINALVKRGTVIEEPMRVRCLITGNKVGGVSAA